MLKRFFLMCLSTLVLTPAMAADSVLIAAGAGYRKPVMELLQAFSQSTGIKAEASFGNMKQVEIQARQNPQISLLIGDKAFLEPMELASSYALLGQGRLVLVAAKTHSLNALADLAQPQFQRIAVPDRSRAVYGKAAFSCLERSGVMPVVQGRLLEVATVPQVSAYLMTGDVDAGFVNKTEAMALKGKAGASVEVAQDCHAPIDLSLAVIKGRDGHAPTQAFINFIATPQARQVMERHGL